MKKLLFIALLGLTIAACSKKNGEVTPDAASSVAGVYTLSYIRLDSAAIPYFGPVNLPYVSKGATAISGTMTASKVTTDSVKIDVHIVRVGYTDTDYTYGTFNLKSNGAAYTLNGYGIQAGTIDGKTLSIDVSYPDYDNPKITDRDVLIGQK